MKYSTTVTIEVDTSSNKIVINCADGRRLVVVPTSRRSKSVFTIADDKPQGTLNDSAQVCRFMAQNLYTKPQIQMELQEGQPRG